MLIEVIIFILASLVLIKSAEYTVGIVSHFARFLRLTEFVTSFIVVAFVAALPDAIISITAALSGHSDLGAGTLLGGNLADMTLILGLSVLATHQLVLKSKIVRNDLYFGGLALMPILLGLDGTVSRIDGVVLLVLGIAYIFVLLREREYFTKPYQNGQFLARQGIFFVLCIALMLISAHFIVSSATTIAQQLGVSELLIGLILVALGTTLPEFVFAIQSIRKGHPQLAVGDILGNVVVDACILMGIISIIQPITISLPSWAVLGVFTALGVSFSLMFLRTDNLLSKNEALALVLFYIAFVVAQLFVW